MEDVSFTDVKIKIPDRKVWLGNVNDVIHQKCMRGGFWGFWEKSVELSLAVRRRRVTFASSQGPCGGCHKCWGGRWKSQHRMIVPLSPYVEKPLNSKVIKSFVLELRSHKCFLCFRIPMFYVYMLWTFYVCFAYHGYVTGEIHLNLRMLHFFFFFFFF